MAGDIDKDGLSGGLGGRQALFQREIARQVVGDVEAVAVRVRRGGGSCSGSLPLGIVGYDEILGADRREIAREGLQRRAEHARNHIHDEGEHGDGERKTRDADLFHLLIVRKADLPEQVEAQQGEDHDPDGEVHFPVQQAPVVGLVRDGEELEAESDFHEAHHDLHGVQPGAALHFLQELREQSEDGEGEGEGHREGKHGDHRRPELALGGLDQDRAHDGTRAGEGHQHEGEGHEEHACKALLAGIRIALVLPGGWEHDLERPEEGGGEDHEHEEEDEVREPVRGQPVEDIGGHGLAAEQAGQTDDDADGHRVQQDDEQAVHEGLEPALVRVFRPLQEEGDRHRDHREHAGGEEHGETPEDGLYDEGPQAAAILRVLRIADGRLVGGCVRRGYSDAESIIFRESAHVFRAGLPGNGAFHGAAGIHGHFLREDGLVKEDEIVLVRLRLRHFLQRAGRDRAGVFHFHGIADAGVYAVNVLPFCDLAGESQFVRALRDLLRRDLPGYGRLLGKNGNARQERCQY